MREPGYLRRKIGNSHDGKGQEIPGQGCATFDNISLVLQCDPKPWVTSAVGKSSGLKELCEKVRGLRAMFKMMQGI